MLDMPRPSWHEGVATQLPDWLPGRHTQPGWINFYGEDYLENDKWLTVNGIIQKFTLGPSISASYSISRSDFPTDPSPWSSLNTKPTTLLTTMTPQDGYDASNSQFFLNSTDLSSYSKIQSLDEKCTLSFFQWLCVALMILLTVSTICMNVIVIILFLSNRHIRSLGNMYYMSLAFADFLIGSLAMPLNIYMQVMCDMWPFSSIACDLYICFDVFSSTASIMHLCVIAIDRYKVIDDPLGYVVRLSRTRVFGTITLIWLAASAISFPGIAWWKVAGIAEHRTAFVDAEDGSIYLECYLAHEVTYIFVSSAVSFYIPLCAMGTVYYKIYHKAVAQSRFLIGGSKHVSTGDLGKLNNGGGQSGRIVLRAHRGGQLVPVAKKGPRVLAKCAPSDIQDFRLTTGVVDQADSSSSLRKTSTVEKAELPAAKSRDNSVDRRTSIFKYKYSTFHKLKTIMKEHKAARTLGLVMGVFIMCWLPFFVLNILSAVIPTELTKSEAFKVVFKIFTWFGYMNSVLNPFLYGVSNRTFRAIYINFLTCGRYKDELKKLSISKMSNSRKFRTASMHKIDPEHVEQALRDPTHHQSGSIRAPSVGQESPRPLKSVSTLPSAVGDIIIRSLTLQLPKREMGHQSCYCQCADSDCHCESKEIKVASPKYERAPLHFRQRSKSSNKANKVVYRSTPELLITNDHDMNISPSSALNSRYRRRSEYPNCSVSVGYNSPDLDRYPTLSTPPLDLSMKKHFYFSPKQSCDFSEEFDEIRLSVELISPPSRDMKESLVDEGATVDSMLHHGSSTAEESQMSNATKQTSSSLVSVTTMQPTLLSPYAMSASLGAVPTYCQHCAACHSRSVTPRPAHFNSCSPMPTYPATTTPGTPPEDLSMERFSSNIITINKTSQI